MSDEPDVAELQQEVARLKAELDAEKAAEPSRTRGSRWRWFGAWLLVILLFVLSPLAVVAAWSQSIVYNTDRYMATVGPLIEEPQVQAAISKQLTEQIESKVDVQKLVSDAASALSDRGAPDQVSLLVPFAVNGINSFISSTVDKVVTSDTFANAWVTANREAHAGLVKALDGNPGGDVTLDDGKVTIRTAAFIDTVKQALGNRGLTKLANAIPSVQASFVVYENQDLAKIQSALSTLNTLGTWLPIAVLLIAVAAIAAAPNRRRATVIVGGALALSMLALAIGISAGRSASLTAVANAGRDTGASAVIFDHLVSLLRTTLRAVFALGLVMALAAWLAGPGSVASSIRGGVGRGIDWLRGSTVGEDESGVRAWFVRFRVPLQLLTVAIAAGVLVFWPYPTAAVVVVIALIALLVLAVLQVLGGRAAGAAEPEAEAPPAEAPPAEVGSGPEQ